MDYSLDFFPIFFKKNLFIRLLTAVSTIPGLEMSSGTSYFAKSWGKAVGLCMYCKDIQEYKVFEGVCA